jgi:hypothetical protein
LDFNSQSHIAHQRDKVFFAYRDKLPALVPFLDDISAIDVIARKEKEGQLHIHNLWRSDQDIPSFARAFVKKEMLCWDDFAVWFEDEKKCTWVIKTHAFAEAVTCKGTNTFYEDGEGKTRVELVGTFEIDLSKVRGVPRFLGKSLGPKLEKFIVNLITPNLEKVNSSIGAFLDNQD